MKIEIIKKRHKQPYRFHLVAANGRILCHSEAYASLAGAEKAIKLIRAGVASAEVITIDKSGNK